MSDQDFFFDDEPAGTGGSKPASAAKGGAKAPAASGSGVPVKSAPSSSGSFFLQSVTVGITALIAVITLLVGLIVGLLIPTGGSTAQPASPAATVAPSLSQDELSSGELPAGHPDISGMTTESATTTGTGN